MNLMFKSFHSKCPIIYSKAFTTFILPNIEYCSVIWNPSSSVKLTKFVTDIVFLHSIIHKRYLLDVSSLLITAPLNRTLRNGHPLRISLPFLPHNSHSSMGSRFNTSRSEVPPLDQLTDVLPPFDQRLDYTTRQLEEIRERRAAIEAEQTKLDDQDSSVLWRPVMHRLTNARRSLRKSRQDLCEQLKEMDEEEERINAQLAREKMWAEEQERRRKTVEFDRQNKDAVMRTRELTRKSFRSKSTADLDDNIVKREDAEQRRDQKQLRSQKGSYAYDAEAWRSRVSGLKRQHLFNIVTTSRADRLFSFVDTFSESERLLAAKDLQFGELRNLWKSFKADVDAMEERLAQRADLESEEIDDDTCTYENSGDESTVGTEFSDSESQIQRTTDYTRDAVDFRRRVDQIMEKITEHETSPSAEISLRMIAQIKKVDLPALAAILGRLMDVHASCDDGELQWNVLKSEWTRLRDAVDVRDNQLRKILQNVAEYVQEAGDFKMRVDKIMAYLSSTTYADHTEELGSVQQIKREDIPYLESCLDRLLDLLVKGKYEGLQKGLQFDELVQEWQRLCDVVKTREGLLLEKLSKEEKKKRIEEENRKKEEEERNRRIEEEMMKRMEEERRKKEEEERIRMIEEVKRLDEERKKRIEEEKRKKEEEEMKRLEEERKKRIEEEKRKKEEEEMKRLEEERKKRIEEEKRKKEEEEMKRLEEERKKRAKALRRERDEDERRAVLERARRENRKVDAKRLEVTRCKPEQQKAPTTFPNSQRELEKRRKQELEKRLKEMEEQTFQMAADMAALKREFGIDGANGAQDGSVGRSVRRTASDEQLSPTQNAAIPPPIDAGPPAATSHDNRSNLAGIREHPVLNRSSSRPRSVTFEDAQGPTFDIVAALNRSPSFIRKREEHATNSERKSKQQETSSQRAPDRMPDVLPSSDRRMSDTARQIREIRERRAAIEEESRRLDEKESALSKNPLIRRLTSARSSVRQSKKALNEQLKIAARPTSYFLFKQLKNDDMPKLEEKLFCFAVKFVDQDKLAAEEDLQLRALYLMWKEFKEVVDTMEKRMMQSEVAVDADSCTDESSGDEVESTLAPTETTDSESHVQRACDYAREAEDFKRRVDQIMEEITEHPSSPPADVSLKMITKIKQVELPALSTSLGRLLDMQAECDDDDLQWGALKIRWTRLRDAVDARAKELKELCEQSAYTEEADCFRSRVDQIKELITSTPSSEHNEALTMIRRIKSEHLPAMEQHLDRLLELLVECSYDGQQWPFETLVQEFTQLINTVKTREFQLLEQIGKKLRDEDSSEENNSRHDKARNCEEESEQPLIIDEENGPLKIVQVEGEEGIFHETAAAAEVDEEEEKIKSRPFDINREIEEEMMRCLAVKEMRVRMEEEKIENEKKTAKMEDRRIEEEKMKKMDVERRKKEEEEEIKKMMELERRKNDQAEKIKKLDEDMKKKKEEIARVQNQLLERQKAAMDQKKAVEARRRSREEKRLKDSNSQVERQADRPRDPSQQRQLLQTELQQKLKTTPLGKAVAAELEDEEDRERKRRNEMRRERDEEERRRAELELARRKDEDRGREAEKLETTRRQQEHQNVSTTSSTNQRQQELEKRLKEMEQEALKRLADEMAALKKEFGLDGAARSVGTSMRRTVSDEHLPQYSAPINTAHPATISHDPRSCLRAGVRERTPLNRASSRPRSVTFGNAQGSENIIAELTRSPSFRRMRAAHASDDESEPEHQQIRRELVPQRSVIRKNRPTFPYRWLDRPHSDAARPRRAMTNQNLRSKIIIIIASCLNNIFYFIN
ncbi:hypothetical protein PRIPAC_87307, partial [Pristionchus pacificus]|uniref:Uncharacterized protein n=1 Tax=Pristionchus pacificus TaxID=54126 RepID=A0A2A6CW87_PRIPA